MLKRSVAHWVPGLSRIAVALDTLEAENRQLKHKLDAENSPWKHELEARQAPSNKPVLRSKGLGEPAGTIGPDGLPVPAGLLRSWVALSDDLDWFIQGGKLGVETLRTILKRQGKNLEDVENLLDFGCGCGRVLRHMKGYDSIRLHGTDCNAEAIRWCDEHLNFAVFSSNTLEPPLRYRSQSFDLIYAFSIFTHLPKASGEAWLKELGRVLKPGGFLVITTNGDQVLRTIDPLSPDEEKVYRGGDLVLRRHDIPGENACVAFHPESYVRRELARDFIVADFLPAGARGNPPQDAYVLTHRAA